MPEILFNVFIFFYGWYCWTFAEYMIHRFWSHTKGNKSRLNSLTRHQHHHSHPTEIRVTVFHRGCMFFTCLILLLTGIYIHFIFFYIAGLMTGFSLFSLIHYILHQSWAEKLFPALLEFHMVHHLKQPDRCFGVSVTWWDRVFKTTPASGSKISTKIISFYYGGAKGKKNQPTRFSLDESLLNDS
ncbi:MAG: sterol desaturase family protein [Chitinophagaceae bacterium]|nr:sterol desaturase family protein [Chitinophagaceae bacterium]